MPTCRQAAAAAAEEASDSELEDAQQLLPWQPAQAQLTWPKAASEQLGPRLPRALALLRRHLPNLRLCHGAADTAVYVSSDPFSLDGDAASLLTELGLRSVVDLRWGHERQEPDDSPLWRRCARAPDWSHGERLLTGPTPPPSAACALVHSVDFLRCPQSDLRRFLCDCPGHLHGSDIGAFAPAACGARPPYQLLADVADSFRTGVGAVLRLLSLPAARPALVVCPDGVCRSGVIACVLQLLAREELSLVAEDLANAQLQIDRHRGVAESEAVQRRAVAEQAARRLQQLLLERCRSVENYVIACGLSLEELRRLKTMPTAA